MSSARTLPSLLSLTSLVAALALGSCAGDDGGDTGATSTSGGAEARAVEVRFAAVVGAAPFACGQSYDGLGTTAASAKATDARLYVHDVALLGGGERYPLALTEDEWQSDGVALLDFEDGSGGCEGTAETNTSLRGTIPAGATVDAVEFTIGVPEGRNHLDNATAPSPLNLPAMFWSWTNGYKFMKVDLRAGAEPDALPFYFHLGSAMCSGDVGSYQCMFGHRVTLRIDGFDPDADSLVFDLAALFAGADLTTPNDTMVDPVDGCMSGPKDPECPAVFNALGLVLGSNDTTPGSQQVFRRQAE